MITDFSKMEEIVWQFFLINQKNDFLLYFLKTFVIESWTKTSDKSHNLLKIWFRSSRFHNALETAWIF